MNTDKHVHRCPQCGSWCYQREPCTTCAIAAQRETEETDDAIPQRR